MIQTNQTHNEIIGILSIKSIAKIMSNKMKMNKVRSLNHEIIFQLMMVISKY